MDKLRQQGQLARLPVVDYIAAISVGLVDGHTLLDLAYDEDSRAEVDLNVVKTGDGRFVEVQGTAEGAPFPRETLDQLLELASLGIIDLVERQRALAGPILGF
jgi:ribonuclease PH